LAFVVYDLLLPLAAAQQAEAPSCWLARSWYRHKTTPSFVDLLTTLRHARWRQFISEPSVPHQWLWKSPIAWPRAVLATA